MIIKKDIQCIPLFHDLTIFIISIKCAWKCVQNIGHFLHTGFERLSFTDAWSPNELHGLTICQCITILARIMAAGRHAPLQSLGGLGDNMAQFSLHPSLAATQLRTPFEDDFPDNKVHGVNMGPTWVLAASDGPHIGPMNLAIRAAWWFERERDTRSNHQAGHFQIWLISG